MKKGNPEGNALGENTKMKLKQLIFKINTANLINRQSENTLVGLEHNGIYFDKPQALIHYVKREYHPIAAEQILATCIDFFGQICRIRYTFDGQPKTFDFRFYNY